MKQEDKSISLTKPKRRSFFSSLLSSFYQKDENFSLSLSPRDQKIEWSRLHKNIQNLSNDILPKAGPIIIEKDHCKERGMRAFMMCLLKKHERPRFKKSVIGAKKAHLLQEAVFMEETLLHEEAAFYLSSLVKEEEEKAKKEDQTFEEALLSSLACQKPPSKKTKTRTPFAQESLLEWHDQALCTAFFSYVDVQNSKEALLFEKDKKKSQERKQRLSVFTPLLKKDSSVSFMSFCFAVIFCFSVSGCSFDPSGSLSSKAHSFSSFPQQESQSAIQFLATSALEQLVLLYPPALTSFSIVPAQKNDRFGPLFLPLLREKGYGVFENQSKAKGNNALVPSSTIPLSWTIEPLKGSAYLILTLTCGRDKLTRAFLFLQQGGFSPSGFWSHETNKGGGL